MIPAASSASRAGLSRPSSVLAPSYLAEPTTWTRDGTGYAGEPKVGADLEVRENANARWGPGEWRQAGWANVVPASTGVAEFDPIGSRRTQAIAAALWLVALGGFAWAGRRFG